MDPKARDFFLRLAETPGVSGFEQDVQSLVREYASTFADNTSTDLHGNVVATTNSGGESRLMLAGHCDQLGLIVSHVDDSGFLYFQTVGGWDPQQLVGVRVMIWAKDGPVTGVVSRKAIHLLDEADRKKVVEIKDLWIDIGATSRKDALSAVQIADSVTVELGIRELRGGFISGPAMDNRAGLWVVMEALRRASERGATWALHSASTVQEEIGLRGAQTAAFGIDPHVAIAVDVTHATDCPSVDKRQRGEIDLGGGPVIVRGPNINPRVADRLEALAAEKGIEVQRAALGRAAPNDANPLQVTRAGVAAGLVQIPNRYMHSPVEMIAWEDIDRAAELLAEFACSSAEVADFIP